MKEKRGSLLAGAFFEGGLKVGERVLRRPTAGSILMLQEFGNPLFAVDEEDEGAPEMATGEYLLAVCGFMWVHVADLEEVIAVAEAKDGVEQYRKAARRLSLEVSEDELHELAARFSEITERVKAAGVRTIEDEGEGLPKKPVPSLTGALPSSGVLERPEMRGGSGTFSGDCPSSGPWPSSTPPGEATVSDAGGSMGSSEAGAGTLQPLPSLSGPVSDGLPGEEAGEG